MKKYSWIVALLLALSLAFFGCPNDGVDDDDDDDDDDNKVVTEWKTVWEMAEDEDIQAIDEGTLTFPAGDTLTDSPFYPLIRAGGNGDVTIEAEKVDGKTSFKFTTGVNWGAGIDLRYSIFNFMVGDKITITGELLSAGAAQANFRIGAEDSHNFKVSAPGPINWEITLTAAWLREIQTGNPAGLRIDGRPESVIVRIDNIKIEGERPSEVVALPAPVLTVTTHGVEWEAIEWADGYEVYADGELLATLPSTATSINLHVMQALEPGDYVITVKALGTPGVSLDSPLSAPVTYTKLEPEESVPYVVPAAGENYFYVDLNDYTSAGTTEGNNNATVPDGVTTEDSLTLFFTENNQRANFKFTDEQIALLASAASLKITIEGDADPDTNFRYHIGDISSGSNWNATNSFNDEAFSTMKEEKAITFSGNKSNATLAYFILNHRAAASTVIEITSIKIEIVMPQVTTVDALSISGVAAPVLEGTPVSTISESAQYTGTVAWDPVIAEGGTFAATTVYTATITLTAKAGYTFDGVEADSFTVAAAPEGTAVTNAANSGLVTAVFPATADHLITITAGAIGGVTAPITGAAPVTAAVTETIYYTGTVAWAGTLDGDGNFAAGTVYTATITLTAKATYTFDGVTANSFTVSGAPQGTAVTNPANTGVVTAVFPATAAEGEDSTVTEKAIAGVTPPVGGATPVTAITAGTQIVSGTVTWSPTVTGTFDYETIYTATIELTAAEGFTFEGVAANFFTVAGTSTPATNLASSGLVTAVFPVTGEAPYAATFEVDGATLKHTNPIFIKFGGWGTSGITVEGNVATVPANTQANFAYVYPIDAEGFDLDEWDFATIKITTVGTVSANGYKVYPSTDADANPPARTGTLTSNGDGSIKVEIRKIPEGLGFQKYSSTDTNAFVSTITEVVYSKGTRYTVTLDADGGTLDPDITTTYFVDGTLVENHFPVAEKEGFTFSGWKNSAGVAVSATTTVTAADFEDETFTAQWMLAVDVDPIVIDFTSDTTVNGGTLSATTATGNYTYGPGGYDDKNYFTFKVTLQTGAVLANYTSLDFTVAAGDPTWKGVTIYASGTDFASTTTAFTNPTAGGAIKVYTPSGNTIGNTATAENLSLEIDTASASTLSGNVLYFSIFIPGGGSDVYHISGVTLK